MRLLDEVSERLPFDWRLVAIGTRHHGSVIDVDGIDARRAVAMLESTQSLSRMDREPQARSGIDLVRQVTDALAEEANEGQLVVVEPPCSTSTAASPPPPTSTPRSKVWPRVTASKAPAAFAFRELAALAQTVGRSFLFEGAVMDGVPVFNLVRETMPGIVIEGFRGVINTTSQFALSEMERGVGFDDAIAEMQGKGIAEADPSLDVDGWDAAAKTAVLVNVLMDGDITPHDVTRMGIRDVSPREVAEAAAGGRRIRLVGSAWRHGGRLDVRVEPELLGAAIRWRRWGRWRSAVSPHGPARRDWHRAAHQLADPDGLRFAQRPHAHQSSSPGLEVFLKPRFLLRRSRFRPTGANRNDSQEALVLVDAIPRLHGEGRRPRSRRRNRSRVVAAILEIPVRNSPG